MTAGMPMVRNGDPGIPEQVRDRLKAGMTKGSRLQFSEVLEHLLVPVGTGLF